MTLRSHRSLFSNKSLSSLDPRCAALGLPVTHPTTGPMRRTKIVSVVDGLPENVPHSAKMAIDINLDNAAGNHIVVDIGQGNFVLYAHIRPATIQVKVGDTVAAGQVIGRVGNTGNS